MKEIQVNEYWLKLYRQVDSAVEDFAVLFDFWKEGAATEEEVKTAFAQAQLVVEEAELKSTLNKPEDELPAILQINAGAGGTESQDWADVPDVWREARLACNRTGLSGRGGSRH
jgi:peptide chain release factor 2